jgi:hypothetical protein
MSGIVNTVFKVPMDTLQFIRNNTLLSVVFFAAAFVGIGLLNNDAPSPPNNIQPVGFDTTSINYFTNEQIQQMWEEWRLNALVANNPAWATDHQFYYVALQQAVGSNQLQTSDPVFGNGAGGFNKAITSLASGLYTVIVSQNRVNQTYYASLFQIVSVVNSNLNPSVPSNQITYPNTFKLSFYDVIDNTANYY